MNKFILVLILICQSFIFSQNEVPVITPESSLQEINKYYKYFVNINGGINLKKVEVFRQALSKYSIMQIANSGLLNKAYNISINSQLQLQLYG